MYSWILKAINCYISTVVLARNINNRRGFQQGFRFGKKILFCKQKINIEKYYLIIFCEYIYGL